MRVGRRGADGMPYPIRPAEHQGELLKGLLAANTPGLLGPMPRGMRTLSRIIGGADQKGFGCMPIFVIVAVSDSGRIERRNSLREAPPSWLARVKKAESVVDVIRSEWELHAEHAPLISKRLITGRVSDRYGLWSMSDEEIGVVIGFLIEKHTPIAAGSLGTIGVCKHRSSSDLDARHGRYGYC